MSLLPNLIIQGLLLPAFLENPFADLERLQDMKCAHKIHRTFRFCPQFHRLQEGHAAPFPPSAPREEGDSVPGFFSSIPGCKSLCSRSQAAHTCTALWISEWISPEQNQMAAKDKPPCPPPALPCPHRAQFVPKHSSLPGFSHHSQARLFQQGLLQLLWFVFLLDQFFWFGFFFAPPLPPPCNQQ